MTLLQLQDVTYRYKNTAEAVLYQIKYNFEPGKFYSIIGESGAGKSTLLSLLAGLDSPVEGSIVSVAIIPTGMTKGHTLRLIKAVPLTIWKVVLVMIC